MKEKKSAGQKFRKGFITLTFSTLALCVVAYLISSYMTSSEFIAPPNVAINGTFFTIVGLGLLGELLYFLSKLMKSDSSSSGSGAKVKVKDGLKKYYDSNWITADDLRQKSQFNFSYYSDLGRMKKSGIPIRAELVNGKMLVNIYDNLHTLVIGSTGSGKTQCFVHPTIQILSATAAKPSFVISDPKGELYNENSLKLEKRGYRLIVLDLRKPFNSTCWNPLTAIYDIYQRSYNLEKEILVHRGDSPKSYPKLNLVAKAAEYPSEWFEFDGAAFINIDQVKMQIHGLEQQLRAEALKQLKDIAITLCPIQSKSDPIWETGAQNFLWGMMIAMLEDSLIPELGMTREKFNFYNLAKMCGVKSDDPENPSQVIKEYFSGRDKLSQATQLASQVNSASETTKKSYMTFIESALNIFSDLGVSYATHTNEMNLSTFDDMPTALFIKIPDEETTRYPIATLFISQLYKLLVDIANIKGGKLTQSTYFLLDEFANMPKIPDFETIITVARSRGIFFLLIVQSYSQLGIKYDEKVALTIKDNCRIHIYIGSNDPQTQKEFSERCGNKTIETESTTSSKGKEDKSASTTTSVSVESVPLIYPAELAHLKDEMIVLISREQPLKSKFTYAYKAKNIYDMKLREEGFTVPKRLNEEAIYYDIKVRNNYIANKNNNNNNNDDSRINFDDFDF